MTDEIKTLEEENEQLESELESIQTEIDSLKEQQSYGQLGSIKGTVIQVPMSQNPNGGYITTQSTQSNPNNGVAIGQKGQSYGSFGTFPISGNP